MTSHYYNSSYIMNLKRFLFSPHSFIEFVHKMKVRYTSALILIYKVFLLIHSYCGWSTHENMKRDGTLWRRLRSCPVLC